MKFEEAILEIKRRIDLARVIGQYVQLKKTGHGLTGLCPFHSEKSPSFHVRPDRGYFKCFGCDAAGDVFTFLEKRTGQLFVDIVHQLGEELGIQIETEIKAEDAKKRAHRAKLQKCVMIAQQFFQNQLHSQTINASPLFYLKQERKFSDEAIQKNQIGFGGFNENELLSFFKKNNVSAEEAFEVGLVGQSKNGFYPFFTRRITIPILNHQGHLVGFGGRIFGKNHQYQPKYINSKASAIYDKKSVLYGLFESLFVLKQNKTIVLAEGYFDVMAIRDVGFAAAGVCGTSLTKEHIHLLSKYTNEVILCLDQDLAGKKAHQKMLLMLLGAGFQVKSASLTDKDPDALWRLDQKPLLKELLLSAKDAVEVLIHETKTRASKGIAERIAAIKALMPFLKASQSPLVNRQYVRLAAQILNEDESLLLKEALEYEIKPVVPPKPINSYKDKKIKWSEIEKLLLRAILFYPQIIFTYDVSPFELNHELLEFVLALQKAYQINPNSLPKEILKSVPEVSGTTIANIRVESLRYPACFNEEDAQKILESFLLENDKKRLKQKLDNMQNSIIAAEQKGDLEKIKQLLNERSQLLKQYYKVESKTATKVEKKGFLSNATEDFKVEPELKVVTLEHSLEEADDWT